jgi:FMN phosphatase YigB (HAD superfamily)
LFDTIVKWDPERLPLFEMQGKQVRSTMPWILPKMVELFGGEFNQERFVETYGRVIEEIFEEREREGIEITCHERFLRTIRRLELGPHDRAVELAETLTRSHMQAVRGVTTAPAARVAAVRRIAQHYRLGLLSNFDDTQCGREVLADAGVAELFETIVISAEVRLRKPDPRIFAHICERLDLPPHAILFVGDTPYDDVLGASRAGMQTVWISKGLPALPESIPTPDFTITDLADLPRVLEV